MAETTQNFLVRAPLRLSSLVKVADWLAVLVAVSLPWSTSATGILIALWLIVLLPTVDMASLRRILAISACAFPIALCLLALIGMGWADVPLSERFGALKPYLKLLVIPLLFIQFQRSERGAWVLIGFLASCVVLLFVSWAHWRFPPLSWRYHSPGMPVKDYIIQSSEFLICAFGLSHLALSAWSSGRRVLAMLLMMLVLLFLANMAYVITARSTLVTLAVFVVLFGFQRFGGRGIVVTVLVGLVFASMAWVSSSHLRYRVLSVGQEISDYRDTNAPTSAGARIEFWRKSVEIISEAPILGHGTGSVRESFRRAALGTEGVSALVTDNPHNQSMVIAIQIGILGMALLYATWIAHLLLFRGNDLLAWLGFAVVLQNVIAGLFNSYLFEFTLGWLYVFGVGVLGGMALRRTQAATPAGAGPDIWAQTGSPPARLG